MLHHRPKPLIISCLSKIFYTLYNPLARNFGYLFRPEGVGVKTFVIRENTILLVKIGYSHKSWVLPGGAVDAGEIPLQAALRETKEETGIELVALEKVMEKTYIINQKNITVHFFTGQTTQVDISIDDQEIVDAGWFDLDDLPTPRRPKLDAEIAAYREWAAKIPRG